MEKTTMNVQELASQMGISLPKAYKLVKQPGFPVIHVGRSIGTGFSESKSSGTASVSSSHPPKRHEKRHSRMNDYAEFFQGIKIPKCNPRSRGRKGYSVSRISADQSL